MPPGYYANALATDGTYLYGVDYGNSHVFKLSLASGNIVASYGTSGSGNDGLSLPMGIAYLPTGGGEIAILDRGNNRVVIRQASTLVYVTQGGSLGSGDGQLHDPHDIATDGEFLYIADSGNNRVVKWTASTLLQTAATTVGAGSGPGQFGLANGLATDGDSVWVADYSNRRVERFNALDLGYLSQQALPAASMPHRPTRVAQIGGHLLVLDDIYRLYDLWGGGPLALTASPSDSTTPFSISYAWSGAAPAGWTLASNTGFVGASTATRYLGWSASAVGGAVNIAVNTFSSSGTPQTINLVADAAPPVVDAMPPPVIDPPLTTSTSLLSARIVFGGSDAASGLASAQLQRSINGGAYTQVLAWTAGLPTSGIGLAFDTTLKTGTTYRFRARLSDRVGNVSAWKYGAAFVPAMAQENGAGVTASAGWSRPATAGAIGGYVRTTSAAGKTITITGVMSQFMVIGPVTVGGGSFKVYADGVLKGTALTSGGSTVNRLLLGLVPFATKKVHTIKLVSVGDGPISIDAFVLFR